MIGRTSPRRKVHLGIREKDQVDCAAEDWKEINRREKKKSEKPRRKIRPNALIIRPEDKTRYTEILTRIKKDESTRVGGECVDKIWKSATSDMLIIVTRCKETGSEALQKALINVLGNDAKVITKGPQEDIEIRDLDEESTKEEVLDALRKAEGSY